MAQPLDNAAQEATRPIIQLAKNEQLLSVKELAWHLNRHPNYVYLLRKAGFPMPGNRTTLHVALKWLEENPDWRRRLDRPKP